MGADDDNFGARPRPLVARRRRPARRAGRAGRAARRRTPAGRPASYNRPALRVPSPAREDEATLLEWPAREPVQPSPSDNQDVKTWKGKKRTMNDEEQTSEQTGTATAAKKPKIAECCPLCLEEYGSNPLASTICGHIFCYACIEQAHRRCKNCPVCRRRLPRTKAHAYHPIFGVGDSG